MKKKILLSLAIATLLPSCGGGATASSLSSAWAENGKEAYEKARKKAVDAEQFEYDFELNAKLKYGSAGYSPATISGTTSFNSAAGETTYVQKRNTSGILLIDSTTWTYNKGTTYIKVAESDGDFSVTDSEVVDSGYNFESKTFGSLLRYLDAEKLEEVKKTEGIFDIHIKPSSTREAVNNVCKFIDCNKFVEALSEITTDKWGVGMKLTSQVEIKDENIKWFKFSFEVTYDKFALEFSYTQTYTHIGSGVTITVPQFKNAITKTDELNSAIGEAKTALVNSKKAEVSYYDYTVKTGVDHGISATNPFGCAVNSTSAGKTKRKIVDGTVYFLNRLELDSDYKNKDQYPDEICDYERYRARINDGKKSVYDCEDKVWPASNVYTLLENYNNSSIDEYYMLLPEKFLSSDYIKIARKDVASDGTKTFKFGMSADGIIDLLETYNKSIRLDADMTFWHDVYQIESGFSAKKCNYEVVVNKDGRIETINILTKGFYKMVGTKQVKFDFNLKIKYGWKVTSYDVPTAAKNIEMTEGSEA
ncbi:MAG: hypothetical protein MJ239_04855 [Bacilli bacterium]|nr:hypothetical protein [Bacilli bacterium]